MRKLLILCIIILAGCTSSYKTITPEEVYNNIDNDKVIIIDVRTYTEYQEGHIKNAINIPLDELNTIKLDKDTTIYVYCQSGNRSEMAIDLLQDLGFDKIYDMGGIINWKYELEKEG